MTRCPQCQAQVDPIDKFCPSCGTKLSAESSQDPNREENPLLVTKKPMPLWFKALILAAVLALIGVTAGILFTESLVDVVDSHLEALREGKIEKAYRKYTSKDFQSATSLEQFQKFIEDYPILRENQSAAFPQRAIKDQITILKGKLTSPEHINIPVEYRLEKEDGKWKILSIRLLKVQSQDSAERKELVKLVKGQLAAIQTGNVENAYQDFTSRDFKQATSYDNFRRFVDKYPILQDRRLTSFHNPVLQDNAGRLSIILESDQYVAYLKVLFVKEDGNWKISSMRILSPYEADLSQQTYSPPMAITSITLGTKADDQGIIVKPKNHFKKSLSDLFVNISIQNGQKGTLFNLLLKHLDSGSSTTSQATLQEEGDTLLSTTFTPPAAGWIPGQYQITVTTSTGIQQQATFTID